MIRECISFFGFCFSSEYCALAHDERELHSSGCFQFGCRSEFLPLRKRACSPSFVLRHSQKPSQKRQWSRIEMRSCRFTCLLD